jgi:drug/metabolite transporter (DMT)-like permease
MKIENVSSELHNSELSRQSLPPSYWQVFVAFAAVYLIWGSTYLAIRYAVESIPPFLMAGTRSLAAGLILYAFARARGAVAPTFLHWRNAAIAGVLLLTIGNGGVTWAELVIPSSVTALLVALVPLWMVLLDWLRPKGNRPRPLVFAGLAVGFLGVALLGRGNVHGSGSAHVWAVTALMAASICWAIGSLFSRQSQKPASPLLSIAMQMISGGGALLILALLRGELATFSLSHVTPSSIGAWLYLTLVGSLVGFTAYVWLLQVSTPARVSTYAYVNPLIAVLLGCTIGHESASRELFVAGALIIAAVVLIVSSKGSGAPNKRNVPVLAPTPTSETG